MLFQNDWFPAIVARIFAARPGEFIFQFAEQFFLSSKMAAEACFYRSSKTPWTRRLQYLVQHPFHNGRRIRKIVVKKCSQSGFTEAVLNCIRWFAKYAPRNVIYAINSAVEAVNIRDRLMDTLTALGEEIFTGDDDDIGRLKLSLRHMIVWFFGSFTAGSFANKQAPFCVSDEAEEHAVIAGDTATVVNLDSRMKDAEEGLHVVLSKPKLEIVKDGKITGGVICSEHAAGNQEIYLVPCPHCGTWQEIEWSRIKYGHCKDLLGQWDFGRVLNETYLQCVATHCDKPITEDYKEAMVNHERSLVPPMFGWFPTAGGPDCDPEVISQHMSDLYSLSKSVSWGRIAIRMIKATTHSARQGVYNHNLGLGYRLGAVKTEAIDILKCRSPYKRGEIPFAPVALLLGGDVGKSNAPWVVGAMNESNDLAVVDWGSEIHPDGLAEIVNTAEYPCRADGKRYKIEQGALDAKHRHEDSYAACMKAALRLWPVMGGGGRQGSRLALAASTLPTYPKWLVLISFNDRDFKTELYTERIKRELPPDLSEAEAAALRDTMPRLLVPENVTNDFIVQLTNEELKEDMETGKMEWVRTGPNHFGDCVKEICVIWRWMNLERKPEVREK